MKCMKKHIDKILCAIQLYSYLLPTCKIGNLIMDLRKKYTINELWRKESL